MTVCITGVIAITLGCVLGFIVGKAVGEKEVNGEYVWFLGQQINKLDLKQRMDATNKEGLWNSIIKLEKRIIKLEEKE